mmetsp:Transcript_36405/g.78604  ORF Transcript_36405/g.78604 Transcript_36405/m.78604 type:complete len:244 (+) Transcript_36405:1351-2082(+)
MPPWMSNSPLRTNSRNGSLNFNRKSMEWKTFTFTACATSSCWEAPGPSCSLASFATTARPCSKPSKAQPGALVAPAWWVAVAPAMAPHWVCPKTRINLLPSLPVQNSNEPTMDPSACVHVFPAFLKTNSSPGVASKTVSTGTRESAQPTMALWGAWLCFTNALRMASEVLPAVGAPAAKRSLPFFSIDNAKSDGTLSSAPVRTPCKPRSSSVTMEGGMAMLLSSNSFCKGDWPRNSTDPVSKW